MLKICRRCGIEVKEWLKSQLKSNMSNFTIDYDTISNDNLVFCVKFENKIEHITLNDFELKADFLGVHEETLQYKWLAKISNNCKILNIDYKYEYKQHLLNQYAELLKTKLKKFDDNLTIAQKLEEKTL